MIIYSIIQEVVKQGSVEEGDYFVCAIHLQVYQLCSECQPRRVSFVNANKYVVDREKKWILII